ncbi:MAG: mechanosensitive ion channel family protein [Chloroflexota bacterium]
MRGAEENINFIGQLLRTTPDWALQIALALTTLIVFYLLRRFLLNIAEGWIRNFLKRFNLGDTGDAVVDALMLPARILLVAGALWLAERFLTPDAATAQIVENLTSSLVLVSGFVAGFRLVDIFGLNERRLKALIGFSIEEQLMPVVRTVIKLILIVIAIFVVMGEWSVDVSGLLASLGIVGLAFSLAAQDTVSNLFGFSTIIGDRPFLVGEYIASGEIEGVVEKVGVRSTRIRKPDRGIITVPNNLLATAPVERFLRRRIQFTLGVTYETTADEMETLLERLREMMRDRDRVIRSSVAVYFTTFGGSSLDIMVLCEVTIRDWRSLLEERESVNLAVMRIVSDMGLSIAFPTRSIYIDGIPDSLKGSLQNLPPEISPSPEE